MTTIIQWNPAYDVATSQFREPSIDVPCLMPWRFMFIQEHTKKVIGCPYHTIPYGDLSTATLDQIWNSAPIQEMRRSLLDKQIPRFCLNHSAACPLIMDAHASGYAPPAESEIAVGEKDYWFMSDGWYTMERIPEPIRWSAARAAFRIRARGASALRIEAMTLKPDVSEAPLTGTVSAGTTELGRFALNAKQWVSLVFPVPASLRLDDLAVALTVDNPWSPKARPKVINIQRVDRDDPQSRPGARAVRATAAEYGDTRELGLAVRHISTF